LQKLFERGFIIDPAVSANSGLAKVQIIGMGFVGLTLAAFLAKRAKVTGVETSKEVLEVLNEGRAHFYEVGLDEAITNARADGSLVFSNVPLVTESRAIFILTIGTPLTDQSVSLEALKRASIQIAEVAKNEDLVIVRSTVSVGSTRQIVAQTFLDLGKSTSVAMCPERTIEGKALEELQNLPQIIGGLTDVDSESARIFFESHGVETVIVSSPEAAEMAKLANNTFRDLQFAFANEIAMVSDAAGISAREVISAANYKYERSNIAFPGLTAGPCLEKDPWILYNAGIDVHVEMSITKASRMTNESTPRVALEELFRRFPKIPAEGAVLLAGLAFKGTPETDDIRGSLAFAVIEELEKIFPKLELWTFDPLVEVDKIPTELRARHLKKLEGSDLDFDLLVVQHNGKQLLNGLKKASVNFERAFTLDFWGDYSRLSDRTTKNKTYVFGGSQYD
jgi:UDP-N-acetyl-D-mannosaminuronic acid dehydrogenase